MIVDRTTKKVQDDCRQDDKTVPRAQSPSTLAKDVDLRRQSSSSNSNDVVELDADTKHRRLEFSKVSLFVRVGQLTLENRAMTETTGQQFRDHLKRFFWIGTRIEVKLDVIVVVYDYDSRRDKLCQTGKNHFSWNCFRDSYVTWDRISQNWTQRERRKRD